jgi:tetratricopeptide (TPR) repeat protein
LTESELERICICAAALSEALGDKPRLFDALMGLRGYYHMCAQYAKSTALAERLVGLAEEMKKESDSPTDGDVQRMAHAHSNLATVLMYVGQLNAAREHFERAAALRVTQPGMWIFSSMTFWLLGYPDQARWRMHRSLVVAHRDGHPNSLGFSMTNLARLNHFLRRITRSRRWAQKTVDLCEAHHIPFWTNLGNLFLGRAWAEAGETQRGIARLRTTLTQMDEDGQQAFCSYFWSLLAEAYACAGQFPQALDALDRGMTYVERNGEGLWHAELLRLRGEYRLALGAPTNEVEACFQRAIAIAREQSARSLELRATMSLARLWQQQGRCAEAHDMLGAIYGWFTEGFKTADLREARALLAELGE